ncbi:MAG: hypothetical protein MRY74_13465 [Neomegalonema sp.]|nr:hypothetical protein [Neomegalonema sp.]
MRIGLALPLAAALFCATASHAQEHGPTTPGKSLDSKSCVTKQGCGALRIPPHLSGSAPGSAPGKTTADKKSAPATHAPAPPADETPPPRKKPAALKCDPAEIQRKLSQLRQGAVVHLCGGAYEFRLAVCNTLWGFCTFDVRSPKGSGSVRIERDSPQEFAIGNVKLRYTLRRIPFKLVPTAYFDVEILD